MDLPTLIKERDDIDKQIDKVRKEERAAALKQIKALMVAYQIGEVKLNGEAKDNRTKVAAKWKDPVTGKTWSGRGIKPKWIATAVPV